MKNNSNPSLDGLDSLNYQPLSNEKLYHYCPTKSFWAILESRTLWLSSIHSLNDFSEWDWGKKLVTKVLNDDVIEFRADFRFIVQNLFDETTKNLHPLIFSLSRNNDLLSQWRAYADNGEGFAFEFDAERMCNVFPANFKEISYTKNEQLLLLKNSLEFFASWWRQDEDTKKQESVIKILPWFILDLLSLKHHSFIEEDEVRMIHILTKIENNWVDFGGHTPSNSKIPGIQVNERVAFDKLAPYIAYPFEYKSLITGVVLGPKNKNTIEEVKIKLSEMGISDIKVSKSDSPYR